MTDQDFLHLHLDQTDYVKQLDISFDDLNLQKLQVLMEYHVLNQRRLIHQILQNHLTEVDEKNDGNRCIARIHNGNQCSRQCKDISQEFCGSHIHSLPYGRIDEKLPDLNQLIEKKTRGRKAKNKTNIELGQIDLNNYIKTQSIIIEGIEYLIDQNNVLFESNSSNTIVGRKTTDNQYMWF
jgi:hypothetical protein